MNVSSLLYVSFFLHCGFKCSTNCGPGTRKRSVYCVHATTNDVVSPTYCKDKRKPRDTRECRRAPCPNEWVMEEWSQVSLGIWYLFSSLSSHRLLSLLHDCVYSMSVEEDLHFICSLFLREPELISNHIFVFMWCWILKYLTMSLIFLIFQLRSITAFWIKPCCPHNSMHSRSHLKIEECS